MGDDEHLYASCSERGNDLAQVIEQARLVRGRLDRVIELAALAHEVVVGIDDEKRRVAGRICDICHGCLAFKIETLRLRAIVPRKHPVLSLI